MSRNRQESSTSENRRRKRFLLVLMYVVFLLPWVVPAAQRTLLTSANSPIDWVDAGFPPRKEYDSFRKVFGAADSVIISWDGCSVDDPRLDDFTNALHRAPAFRQGDEPVFHQIVSGRKLLHSMMAPPLSMHRRMAVDRLSGSLIGPDGHTTCVVIGFSDAALKQRSTLVPLIRAAASRYCDVPYASQHLAGPVIDGYQVDVATKHILKKLAPLSSLVVLLICYLCLDSIPATMFVFGVSAFCQAVTLALIDFTGGTMTALMSVLAPLVQVLAIAGGIHYINYYFDVQQTSPEQSAAPVNAFRIAWLPCTLSAATTAIGLGSLSVSGLVAVREFGQYAAFGVLITAVSLLTFLSGFCSLWPITAPRIQWQHAYDAAWQRLASWIQSNSAAIIVVAALLMTGLGVGVSRLQASVRIETLFAGDSRLIRDYQWIESEVGSLVPIEIVASFDDSRHSSSEQLLSLARISATLQAVPQVNAVVTPVTFLPAGARLDDQQDSDRLLAIVRASATNFNLCAIDRAGQTRWRATAFVSALADNDYVKIMADVNRALRNATEAKLEVSGLMPLVHHIQRQLLTDLFNSFLLAFGLISIVMTVVQAGIFAGLLSMVPNVFPALTLFGLLGWLDRPLDIGTIMTASVAMGIAVDDTLHFLAFFHGSLNDGSTRHQAVASAYRHCGPAMIQTTAICGGGLALFMLSDFVPTAGFAWMSVLLLVAALLGDLIILPAVLLSPLIAAAACGAHRGSTEPARWNERVRRDQASVPIAAGRQKKLHQSQAKWEIGK